MSVTSPDAAPIPDTYTPATQFGAVLIEAMGPWATLHLAWLLDAIGAAFDPVYTLVSDTGTDDGTEATIGTTQNGVTVTTGYSPGYGSILDVNRCPTADLGYLGQYVGVSLPSGVDDSTARSLIRQEAGMARGTPTAVITAAQRNLTGTQSVTLLERQRPDGVADAYWFVLVVKPSELISSSALIAAVNAVKPGGLMWALVTTGWLIGDMESTYSSSTIGGLEAAFSSIANLEADLT